MSPLDAAHAERHAAPLPVVPGEIRWNPAKTGWLVLNLGLWLALGPLFVDAPALIVWALSSAFCLCVGHSVGLHRGLIHGAFKASPNLERLLAYVAALCGLGGPLGLMEVHYLRDTWQSRRVAPAFYSYHHGVLRDFWWVLCNDHVAVDDARRLPPGVPSRFADDPFYRLLDATWRWQQLPWAVLFYALGGLPMVVWGVFGRVGVCLIGHWFVNVCAHRWGDRAYQMDDCGEEGRNNWLFGALSMGEGWHNNHHAWPSSARMGLVWWQLDPGYVVVCVLERAGLIWDVKRPGEGAALRPGAQELHA